MLSRPPRRSERSLPRSVYPLRRSSMSDLRVGEEQKYFCYFGSAKEKADGVDGEDGVKMNC